MAGDECVSLGRRVVGGDVSVPLAPPEIKLPKPSSICRRVSVVCGAPFMRLVGSLVWPAVVETRATQTPLPPGGWTVAKRARAQV